MDIYISNLPHTVTEQQVRDLFAPFGEIESISLAKDRHRDMPEGKVYVTMPFETEAEEAIAALDGSEYEGQILEVVAADAADFPPGNYW